jgi:L-asparaginase
MSKPAVAVASLGGTITMTVDPDGRGVRPTLGAAGLIDAVPALQRVATVTTETLFTVPGASLKFTQLLDTLNWARKAVAEGNRGVVIVQGTDTIEESAYFFDLYWDLPEPLVVTGAMRPPQSTGPDGPSNLLAAVCVAADASSRGLGVLVTMNDEIHAASRVRKVRASGPAAFSSPSFGSLGYVEEGRVVYGNHPAPPEPLALPDVWLDQKVALLETHLEDSGELLELAAEAGFDGIVLAGFGVGHVSESLAARAGAVARTRPVVLATRTGAGTTFEGTYGFPGSETDLLERGIIPAGWLDGRKACVLLNALLAAGHDLDSIRREFVRRGRDTGRKAVDEAR